MLIESPSKIGQPSLTHTLRRSWASGKSVRSLTSKASCETPFTSHVTASDLGSRIETRMMSDFTLWLDLFKESNIFPTESGGMDLICWEILAAKLSDILPEPDPFCLPFAFPEPLGLGFASSSAARWNSWNFSRSRPTDKSFHHSRRRSTFSTLANETDFQLTGDKVSVPRCDKYNFFKWGDPSGNTTTVSTATGTDRHVGSTVTKVKRPAGGIWAGIDLMIRTASDWSTKYAPHTRDQTWSKGSPSTFVRNTSCLSPVIGSAADAGLADCQSRGRSLQLWTLGSGGGPTGVLLEDWAPEVEEPVESLETFCEPNCALYAAPQMISSCCLSSVAFFNRVNVASFWTSILTYCIGGLRCRAAKPDKILSSQFLEPISEFPAPPWRSATGEAVK